MRTLVIGDIHSGLKALEQVLQRAGVSPDDTLIFLGDYVDGWSEAVETVDFLKELEKTHTCIFLRGNHDQLTFEWLTDDDDKPMWLQHGGLATLKSYRSVTEEVRKRHIPFYDKLIDYHLDAKNRLFLHAGFTHLRGVEHEYFNYVFYWDRTLWETALSLDPNMPKDHPLYPKRLSRYDEIYIGHTPVTRIGKTVPQKAANVWNMDTGAGFEGPLSIMDVDTKEVWQSDPVYIFYPHEKGRNQK